MAEIPEDLITEHRIFSTGKNVRPTADDYVKLIERIAKAEAAISTSNANVAAAQDEIAKLRAQLQTGWEHSQHFYNTETGQVECECCCKWALDMIEQDKEIATLKAQIATLTAQWEDMRDCVLNERDSLAESGMTSDQINAVLGVIDDHAPAARAKAADAVKENNGNA